jgi:hypothetical protein
MKTIDLDTLNQVTGGLTKSSELTASLSSIQSSIKDLGSNNNNQSSNLLLPIMMMAMNNRRQGPSVVSAGGATVVA